MTVKGLHLNNFKQKELDESLNPHPNKFNGANNTSPRDLNLNHYKSNQVFKWSIIFEMFYNILIMF